MRQLQRCLFFLCAVIGFLLLRPHAAEATFTCELQDDGFTLAGDAAIIKFKQMWVKDCGPFPVERFSGYTVVKCQANPTRQNTVEVVLDSGLRLQLYSNVPALKTFCGASWTLVEPPGLPKASSDFPKYDPVQVVQFCVTYKLGTNEQTEAVKLEGGWIDYRAEQWIKSRFAPSTITKVKLLDGTCQITPQAARKIAVRQLQVLNIGPRIGRFDATTTLTEKCIASYDDSHGVHKFSPFVTRSLRHCIMLRAWGPVSLESIGNAFVDKCRDDALNDKKTQHIIELIAAIYADFSSGGSTGGAVTSAKLVDYASTFADNFIGCLTDKSKLEKSIGDQLKGQFSASIDEESYWVYSDE